MIQITGLNKQALKEFITSGIMETMPFWPITPHRALSQIENPRVSDEDFLLFLAYEGEEMVGYLGVLPDWIYLKNKNRRKCGWLSCMWINPLFRGKGISYKLVNSALENWNNNILVTEFTIPAKGLYDKIGVFDDLAIIRGIRLYRRFDLAKILPPKKKLYQRLKPIWKFFDVIGNIFCDIRFLFSTPKLAKLKMEYQNPLDQQVADLIAKKNIHELFKRTKIDQDWIMNHPWILSKPINKAAFSKYYFSSVAKDFSFHGVRISDTNGRLIGFLMFSKRDYSLKIPYAFFDSCHTKEMADVVNFHLNKWRINTLTIFNKNLVEYYKNRRSGFLLKRDMRRHYIVNKQLVDYLPDNFEIQDGDGDAAFT